MKNNKNRRTEAGNALIFVLIGVVMFTALSFTVSRGMRSDTTRQMTEREAELVASDLLNYAQRIERAVNRLRRKGVSENEISFENDVIGTYVNANCGDDTCKVFHPNGGGITFRSAENFIPTLAPSNFQFQANNRFATFGCETSGDSACSEMVIRLNLNNAPEVCRKINDLVDVENPSGDAPRLNEWITGAGFTGTFGAPTNNLIGGPSATNDAPEVNGKSAACVFEFSASQDTYHFYHILLTR